MQVTTFFTCGALLVACAFAAPAADSRRPDEPEIRIPALERRVHDLINHERENGKLGALEFDERLSRIARAHSQDMARRRFFGHTNPDGLDATARGKAAGYDCRKEVSRNSFRVGLGENLFQSNRYASVRISGNERSYDWNSPEQIARESVVGWMNSPPHRRNILEKLYTLAGLGIAISSDDKVYLTQLFC